MAVFYHKTADISYMWQRILNWGFKYKKCSPYGQWYGELGTAVLGNYKIIQSFSAEIFTKFFFSVLTVNIVKF